MDVNTDPINLIRRDIIGSDSVIGGPFGPRRSVYVDNAGSGQSLQSIENIIRDQVLPHYSNTHSSATYKSEQTTSFRNEAREIVRKATGASKDDVVLFCGSGATAPIHKLVKTLIPDNSKEPPIIFIGQFEHHSNILPWRESGAEVVMIPETSEGLLDLQYLEQSLKREVSDNCHKRLIIGSFSAASNITGIVTDDVEVTIMLHKYGALAVWDYSSAAAHVQVIMNPEVHGGEICARKDAIFFSGHKFVGGPQTPGVLIAKNSLFPSIPHGGGGGTVLFVTEDNHEYLNNTEEREEGGTPPIIESIRLGLVINMKELIGSEAIMTREAKILRKLTEDWSRIPEMMMLGPTEQPKIPIIPFLIKHIDTGYFLHHSFIVRLLNDLFGIMTRGGCGCAGPYAAKLLGIDVHLAGKYGEFLSKAKERANLVLKPGFVRLSIPYYLSDEEVHYVSEAVEIVAKHGWKLLSQYEFNQDVEEFCHILNPSTVKRLPPARITLSGVCYEEAFNNSVQPAPNFKECLEMAKILFEETQNGAAPYHAVHENLASHPLRWFMLPSESFNLLNNIPLEKPIQSPRPFCPKTYLRPSQRTNFCQSIPDQIIDPSQSKE